MYGNDEISTNLAPLTNDTKRGSLDQGSGSLSTALVSRDTDIDKIDDKKLCAIIKNLIQQSEWAKAAFWTPRWLRALYFFLGHQHIYWSTGQQRWYPMLLKSDRRITINHVMPYVVNAVDRKSVV